MPYRDDAQPLKEREESLSQALAQVRSHARALASEETALTEELERVRALRESPRSHRTMLGLVVATSCCGLLLAAAFARLMTSEIAPFGMDPHARSTALMAPSVTSDVDTGSGYLRVDAPTGSRIYEGDHFLGTAPFLQSMPTGIHSIRAVPPRGPARTKLGMVYARDISEVHFD